jgi:hypothetical protein
MIPQYDADTFPFYVICWGEGNINFFDFSNGTIKFANEYRSNVKQKGIVALPWELCIIINMKLVC